MVTETPASPKSIRFFEFASVIPLLDPEQLHEHVVQAYGHHGRPQLASRTYSVPIPSSFTSLFASPPPREYAHDPSFIPNSPPRLNVKLPSFVRKRRHTLPCQSQLKPILKKRKTVVAGASDDNTNTSTTIASLRRNKGRSYTLASSAPVSAPSASCSISNVDPVYCPALAKIVARSSNSQVTQATTGPLSSLSSTGQMSNSPPHVDPSTAVGSPTQPLPPSATELLPIRDCCRACRKAATYGEKCADSTYHEHWSKAALEKRKRDEETKFERGEYTTHDNLRGNMVHSSGGDGSHLAGSDVAEVVETLEREEAKHCHILGIPLHSPRSSPDLTHSPRHSPKHTLSPSDSTSPAHSPSSEQGRHHTPPRSPLLAHVHNQIQAHQEAQHDKQVAHEANLDAARQRIARLDIGKKPTHYEEEEDHDDGLPCSESSPASELHEQEGDDLELEGMKEGEGRRASVQDAGRHPSREDPQAAIDYEKNPICTLDGQVLRPCLSKSLYTGGPSIRSAVATGAMSKRRDSDQSSTASSSDLSDDLVSNLSSLGLSPASATTHASSWFGSDDLSSPPLPSFQAEAAKKDYFSLNDGRQQLERQAEEQITSPAKAGSVNKCSPLTRAKCLRPAGMYAPLPVGQDEVRTESCPTIREEDGSASPPMIVGSPRGTIHRANTTTGATPSMGQEADDLEFAKALKAADKPVFITPVRTQSLPAYSAGRGTSSREASSGLQDAEVNTQDKPSWASKFFHRSRGLSSLGVAHGIVH